MPGLHGITDRAAAARHMGRQACAALLLTAPCTDNVYTMLYVHTRSNQQGAGCGSSLLQQAKLFVGSGTLRTHAAACRTYYATLLTLRNGFMADIALFHTDIPLPGQAIPTGSSELDLWWSPRITAAEQLAFVKQAHAAQCRRRSHHARAYAEDLKRVIARLEPPPEATEPPPEATEPPPEASPEAPPEAPLEAPEAVTKKPRVVRLSSACDLSAYQLAATPDPRLPPGWRHVVKARPGGRSHSRFVAPDGRSTDRMKIVLASTDAADIVPARMDVEREAVQRLWGRDAVWRRVFGGSIVPEPVSNVGLMGRLTPTPLIRVLHALCLRERDVVYDVGVGHGAVLCAAHLLSPGVRLVGIDADNALIDAARHNLAVVGATAELQCADVRSLKDLGDATVAYCFTQGLNCQASSEALLRACRASRALRVIALLHDGRQRSHPIVRFGNDADADGRASRLSVTMAGGGEGYTCWVVHMPKVAA